jgi:hypothetical protein
MAAPKLVRMWRRPRKGLATSVTNRRTSSDAIFSSHSSSAPHVMSARYSGGTPAYFANAVESPRSEQPIGASAGRYRRTVAVARCARCSRSRPVFRRSGQELLCDACAARQPRTRGICTVCNRGTYGKYTVSGGSRVCAACYRREIQPKRLCAICGKIERATIRLDREQFVCSRCYLT